MFTYFKSLGNHAAIDYCGRIFLHRDLDTLSDALAAFWSAQAGLKPGQHLGVVYSTHPAFWLTVFSAMKLGLNLEVFVYETWQDICMRNAFLQTKCPWILCPLSQAVVFRKHTALLDRFQIVLWDPRDFMWPLRSLLLRTADFLFHPPDLDGFHFAHSKFTHLLKVGKCLPLPQPAAPKQGGDVFFIYGDPPALQSQVRLVPHTFGPQTGGQTRFEVARLPLRMHRACADFLWAYELMSQGILVSLHAPMECEGIWRKRHPHVMLPLDRDE